MSLQYIWKEGEVITRERGSSDGGATRNLLMVDSYYDTPTGRYGLFTEDGQWRHIPLEDFPAEFKTHLLLLGAS